MRILSMIAVAGFTIASGASAFAGELPSYEVKSFPISEAQVQFAGRRECSGGSLNAKCRQQKILLPVFISPPISMSRQGAIRHRQTGVSRARNHKFLGCP
jgi:hypothetical protein